MKRNELLNTLPEKVQNEVMETLKAWSGCYVMRHEQTGEYRVEIGIGLTKGYNPWKCVASFECEDIYDEKEREENAKKVWSGVEWF